MSRSDIPDSSSAGRRIDELLADQALGNLDPADAGELRAPVEGNSFNDTVSSLTMVLAPAIALPRELARKIEADAAAHLKPTGVRRNQNATRDDRPQTLKIAAWTGWILAAAACAGLILALQFRQVGVPPTVASDTAKPPASAAPTPAELRAELLARPQIVKAEWSGMYARDATGDVVWSDAEQRGYMRFANLPVNDPQGWQYQLWIFDAEGNEAYPVDGGVFNSTSTGELIIPIDPKIRVGKAVMFAVTVEKPGGVVVSDRAKIAVLAKPA